MKNRRCERVKITLKKSSGFFLKHNLFSVMHLYSDGSKSKKYSYELVSRKGTDSVVVLLYFIRNGEVFVGLKEEARLAKVLRNLENKQASFPIKDCYLLEAVAGSLEPNEKNLKQIKKRVKTETLEEAGYDVNIDNIISLGKPFFSSPGQSTEKIYPFAVKIEKERHNKAIGDGSLLEKESGEIKFFPLKKAFKMIEQGRIEDAKTEISIHRLFLKLNLL
ncbi:MAG: hypothetical protein ACE14Q_03945 [Acidobacteriota bacterium]